MDHIIVFTEEHLRRILSEYARYYNEVRTGRAQSSGSETLLRSQSLADYTIECTNLSSQKPQVLLRIKTDEVFDTH
jgi:hypothetical protein